MSNDNAKVRILVVSEELARSKHSSRWGEIRFNRLGQGVVTVDAGTEEAQMAMMEALKWKPRIMTADDIIEMDPEDAPAEARAQAMAEMDKRLAVMRELNEELKGRQEAIDKRFEEINEALEAMRDLKEDLEGVDVAALKKVQAALQDREDTLARAEKALSERANQLDERELALMEKAESKAPTTEATETASAPAAEKADKPSKPGKPSSK